MAVKPPMTGGVLLVSQFFFARPARHLRNGEPTKFHVQHPTSRQCGDLSKLVRCLEDGLTGIVWVDDSQVVYCEASKRYVSDLGSEGCKVSVEQL